MEEYYISSDEGIFLKSSYDVHKKLQRRKKRNDLYSKYFYKMVKITSQIKMENNAII